MDAVKESTNDDWRAYWQTIHWRLKRAELIKKAGYLCEYCGAQHQPLEVHHLNYNRVGNEQEGDTMVTCKMCHPLMDHYRRVEERDARRLFRNYRRKPKQIPLF